MNFNTAALSLICFSVCLWCFLFLSAKWPYMYVTSVFFLHFFYAVHVSLFTYALRNQNNVTQIQNLHATIDFQKFCLVKFIMYKC